MAHMLKMSTLKLSTPIALLIGIKPSNLLFHEAASRRMLGPDHDEQHFEPRCCLHRMRLIRRQDNRLPLTDFKTLAGDLDVRVSVCDYHKCIEWRGVLAEALAHVKREEGNRAALVLQHDTTHDRAILVLEQVDELFDLSRFYYILILVTHNDRFTHLGISTYQKHRYLFSVC